VLILGRQSGKEGLWPLTIALHTKMCSSFCCSRIPLFSPKLQLLLLLFPGCLAEDSTAAAAGHKMGEGKRTQ